MSERENEQRNISIIRRNTNPHHQAGPSSHNRQEMMGMQPKQQHHEFYAVNFTVNEDTERGIAPDYEAVE